jgi:hypothetical protein
MNFRVKRVSTFDYSVLFRQFCDIIYYNQRIKVIYVKLSNKGITQCWPYAFNAKNVFVYTVV